MSEPITSHRFQVAPSVRQLNKYVQRAKRVAINSIDPVYFQKADGQRELKAFNVLVEGPDKYISYLKRLLADANFKIS